MCVLSYLVVFSHVVIHYFSFKVFSWKAFLTFQVYNVGPSGAVCVPLSEGRWSRERGRCKWRRGRTRPCLISGMLSHTGLWWRDRCSTKEESEQRGQTKWEFWEVKPRWSPSSFMGTNPRADTSFFIDSSLSCTSVRLSGGGGCLESVWNMWGRLNKKSCHIFRNPSEVWCLLSAVFSPELTNAGP